MEPSVSYNLTIKNTVAINLKESITVERPIANCWATNRMKYLLKWRSRVYFELKSILERCNEKKDLGIFFFGQTNKQTKPIDVEYKNETSWKCEKNPNTKNPTTGIQENWSNLKDTPGGVMEFNTASKGKMQGKWNDQSELKAQRLKGSFLVKEKWKENQLVIWLQTSLAGKR